MKDFQNKYLELNITEISRTIIIGISEAILGGKMVFQKTAKKVSELITFQGIYARIYIGILREIFQEILGISDGKFGEFSYKNSRKEFLYGFLRNPWRNI